MLRATRAPSTRESRRARDRAPALVERPTSWGGSAPQLGLDLSGVLQARCERGAHIREQLLQLRVLGAGDQGLIERVENVLVISDLVVDVGLVEGRSGEVAHRGAERILAGRQSQAGFVVLRREA